MNWLHITSSLPAIALASGIAFSASADEHGQGLGDLKKRYEDELAILNAHFNLEKRHAEIAEQRRIAAEETRDAKLAAEMKLIIVNRALVMQVDAPRQNCDATNAMRYHCERKVDCAEIEVDKKLCGSPAVNGGAMILEVQFSCGTSQRTRTFPFGQLAYLECR
jgi:hypothetical protein